MIPQRYIFFRNAFARIAFIFWFAKTDMSFILVIYAIDKVSRLMDDIYQRSVSGLHFPELLLISLVDDVALQESLNLRKEGNWRWSRRWKGKQKGGHQISLYDEAVHDTNKWGQYPSTMELHLSNDRQFKKVTISFPSRYKSTSFGRFVSNQSTWCEYSTVSRYTINGGHICDDNLRYD